MTISFNIAKRTCRAVVETEAGPQELVVSYRACTAAERQEMRCAWAAAQAKEATGGDKGATGALHALQSDAADIVARQSVDVVLDIQAPDGSPVLFDGLPWSALSGDQRANIGTALTGLFSLIYQQANPQMDARLLGK